MVLHPPALVPLPSVHTVVSQDRVGGGLKPDVTIKQFLPPVFYTVQIIQNKSQLTSTPPWTNAASELKEYLDLFPAESKPNRD